MTRVTDGLRNALSGLGTDRDKATGSQYHVRQLSVAQLDAAYRTSWVMRKIVEIPAFDACRKWRVWTGEGAEAIEELEGELGLQGKVLEARIRARLYGGAAILIGADDMDLAEPLEIDRVGAGDLAYLTVLTRMECLPSELELDVRHPRYGLPKKYHLPQRSGEQADVHPSRLVVFRGNERPTYFTTSSLSDWGWGDSVLQSAYDTALSLDATMANIASLVFEAKLETLKIPGLSEALMERGRQAEQALIDRMTTLAIGKSNHRMRVVDGNEEVEMASYSFAGLADISDRFMQVAAGAADIPVTRFFGQSPGGLNASGESDLRNYYDRIEAEQTLRMQPAMAVLDEVLKRAATGGPAEDANFAWRPLMQMTEQQMADVLEKTARSIDVVAKSQLFGPETLAQAAAERLDEAGLKGIDPDEDPLTGGASDEELGLESASEAP